MALSGSGVKITVLRQGVVAGNPGGNSRSEYQDAFWAYADMQQESGRSVVQAGLQNDEVGIVLRVNDSAANRTITIADRIRLMDREFAIQTVGLPDRLTSSITLTVTQSRLR